MKKGSKHSDETKRKLSEKLKKMHKEGKLPTTFKVGHFVTEETKQKLSKSNTGKFGHWNGKTFSNEHKESLSIALTGRKLTKEHKENISKGLKGMKRPPQSEEHKLNLSKALKGRISPMLGKSHSRETKEKISKALTGRIITKEWRQKLSNAQTGKKLSKETKEKIRKALIGRTFTDEWRERLSAARVGRVITKETREKMSKSAMGRTFSKETREKLSKALTGRKFSKEHREKLSGRILTEDHKQKLRISALNQRLKGNNKNTLIELALQQELDKIGLTYNTHMIICGHCRPDIVFPEQKVAIFADGNYWHNYPHGKERDMEQVKILEENGWVPLRFWGSEIRKDLSGCMDRILEVLN